MPKEKPGFGQRSISFFTNHAFLKLVSLGLAIIAWFYARGEIR
jgi:hypothetical protein